MENASCLGNIGLIIKRSRKKEVNFGQNLKMAQILETHSVHKRGGGVKSSNTAAAASAWSGFQLMVTTSGQLGPKKHCSGCSVMCFCTGHGAVRTTVHGALCSARVPGHVKGDACRPPAAEAASHRWHMWTSALEANGSNVSAGFPFLLKLPNHCCPPVHIVKRGKDEIACLDEWTHHVWWKEKCWFDYKAQSWSIEIWEYKKPTFTVIHSLAGRVSCEIQDPNKINSGLIE